MRYLSFLFVVLFGTPAFAQSLEENELVTRLTFSSAIPTELLATRSVVLFQSSIPQKDLDECQSYFQQSGIDAVAYFDINRMLAGHDVRKAYASYLANRGIKFLILFQKDEKGYRLIFCPFNGKKDLVDANSAAWKQENASLNELLRTIYRFAVSNLKKQNFLINDLPEMDITIKPFTGRINESFSVEVKSFKTAIPKFGNPADDAELEAYLKANFPLKYELVDADATEESLYTKGFRTILRFAHARVIVAKEILGYDVTQVARSLPSAVFVNNEIQIKTIPSDQVIYKFYFKNIEYGNVFLGNKWDADLTWQDALRNHIQAYKINQKIN
ncbi:MAG: hypothetical protein ACK5RG_08880 [Cyclobacteriaceae bacterium]|nr:hypothetical protein [Flammeovirgaceae bacterium]